MARNETPSARRPRGWVDGRPSWLRALHCGLSGCQARTKDGAGNWYATSLTPTTNDWGVDIFAERHEERLAVQVKMYGRARPVNRQMIRLREA